MPGADTLLNTHQGSQFLGFFFLLFFFPFAPAATFRLAGTPPRY